MRLLLVFNSNFGCIYYRFEILTFKAKNGMFYWTFPCLTSALGRNPLEFAYEKTEGCSYCTVKFHKPNFSGFCLIHWSTRVTDGTERNRTDCAVENEGSHVIGEFVDGRGVQFWNCRRESNCHVAKRWGCCEVEPPSKLLFYVPELRLANLRTGWLLHGTEFSRRTDRHADGRTGDSIAYSALSTWLCYMLSRATNPGRCVF